MTIREGFKVNDPEHLNETKRETSGWGFVREDLAKFGVHMLTNVHLVWDETTPPEMRKVFAEASHVLHTIAERAINAQLQHDGLTPVEQRDLIVGGTKEGSTVLRDSGWHPTR